MKLPDQIDVVSRRLAFVGFEAFENGLDPVDGAKDEGDGLGRDRHAVAEFAHQAFGSVREGLQPGQTEKAAGALDGMDEPKDVAEDVAVIRLLLEAHQLRIDAFENSRWSRSGTPRAGRPSKAPLTHNALSTVGAGCTAATPAGRVRPLPGAKAPGWLQDQCVA